MRKNYRLLLILLICIIPILLMRDRAITLVTQLDFARLERKGYRLLMPPVFGIWTLGLGILVYSWYCWLNSPSKRNFIIMFSSSVVLGYLVLFIFYMALFAR